MSFEKLETLTRNCVFSVPLSPQPPWFFSVSFSVLLAWWWQGPSLEISLICSCAPGTELTAWTWSVLSQLLFSCSVVSDSLQPHGLQHARLPCPSLYPGVCSNLYPLSHPLSSPSPPTLNLSQHQGLFQWVGSLHQVTKVLELQFQHQSFQWIFRVDFL